jgi:hypothetical protein
MLSILNIHHTYCCFNAGVSRGPFAEAITGAHGLAGHAPRVQRLCDPIVILLFHLETEKKKKVNFPPDAGIEFGI